MPFGHDIAHHTASRADRARRLLRTQLEALVGLAAVALRMIELAAPLVAIDPHRPLACVAALERSVHSHARVSWALRLLWALRAKLVRDLACVERGEGVDEVLAAEARTPVAAGADLDDDDNENDGRPERRETLRESEGLERESFGRYLSRRSGEDEFAEILKRPTQEVIALIREALGLSPAPSEDPLDSRLEQGRSSLLPRFIAPPRPPEPGLRSPCPV